MNRKNVIVKFPKYIDGQKVYLYTGKSCVLVTIISNRLRGSEYVYDIDCSNYDEYLKLKNVPERFLGKSVKKGAGNDSLTIHFLEYVGRMN